MSWLLDKSAYVYLTNNPNETWAGIIHRGMVSVATVTLLEIGFSARNAADHQQELSAPPLGLMPVVPMRERAERRAVDMQFHLASRGHHRAVSIPDLIIAAIAEDHGLTVLHNDKDFDLISELTGLPVVRP